MGARLTISIVIPTLGREAVLVETIRHHLKQAAEVSGFQELIVIDQTRRHHAVTSEQLGAWHVQNKIRWIKHDEPHLTRCMNLGLLEASSDIVLYTDDDVVPAPGWLDAHIHSHEAHPDAWAVVGQVLQPGQQPVSCSYAPSGGRLTRFLDFPFHSSDGQYIENAMAGNLSLKRIRALSIGGFDENFPPPVAARFESEFAKRVLAAGGLIYFESKSSIKHLAHPTGGTRSEGSHLKSASPVFGVGDYYYALRCAKGLERALYILTKPMREIRTRFHLTHPWWIPVKLVGELRALIAALRLSNSGPRMLTWQIQDHDFKAGCR